MYSAKDLEELNAKNIEYPDGSRSQVYGFGKSTSQKAVWKNEKQKVYAAANSAIRNTGRVLEFNSKASFYKSSA